MDSRSLHLEGKGKKMQSMRKNERSSMTVRQHKTDQLSHSKMNSLLYKETTPQSWNFSSGNNDPSIKGVISTSAIRWQDGLKKPKFSILISILKALSNPTSRKELKEKNDIF